MKCSPVRSHSFSTVPLPSLHILETVPSISACCSLFFLGVHVSGYFCTRSRIGNNNRKCPPPLFGYLFKYLQVVMSSLTGRGREGFPASIRGGLWVSPICSFFGQNLLAFVGFRVSWEYCCTRKNKTLGCGYSSPSRLIFNFPLPKPTYILIYHDLFLRAQKCSITLRPQGRTASPRSAPLLWVPEGPGATHIGICAREQTMSRLTSPSLDL